MNKKNNHSNRKSLNKQSGVAAIEFAIGFIAFWLMCVVWIELSYISYVSALGDLMISQASRQSKLHSSDEDFIDQFENVIKNDDSIWKNLVNKENFRYSIRYVKDYDQLSTIKDSCESKDENTNSLECDKPNVGQAPIAIYRISYQYEPIFSYFGDSKSIFSREMIVIQEYQRSAFNLGG